MSLDNDVMSRMRLQYGLDENADTETVERVAAANFVKHSPESRAQWLASEATFFGSDASPRQKAEAMRLYRTMRNIHNGLKTLGR